MNRLRKLSQKNKVQDKQYEIVDDIQVDNSQNMLISSLSEKKKSNKKEKKSKSSRKRQNSKVKDQQEVNDKQTIKVKRKNQKYPQLLEVKQCKQLEESISYKPNMIKILSKYSQDQNICLDSNQQSRSICLNKQQIKQKPIKIKNKLFSEIVVYEPQTNLFLKDEQQTDQLIYQKTQKITSQPLLQKINSKAEKFKNRLQFKNSEQDHKFKKNLLQKLKSVEDAEEVNVVIEIPKILGGRLAHTEAALYLKNTKDKENSVSEEQLTTNQTEEQRPQKSRKQYYEDFNKQLKLKKVQTITESALKACFKKSSLDEHDYIKELEDNQSEYNSKRYNDSSHNRSISNSRKNITKDQNSQKNKEEQKLPSNEIFSNASNQHSKNIKLNLQKQIQEKKQSLDKKISKKGHNPKQSQRQSLKSLKQVIKKQKQNPKSKKGERLSFRVKDFIEEQAEESNSLGVPKEQMDSSNSSHSENEDLPDLIDNNPVNLTNNDRKLAYRKYISDIIQDEEKYMEKINKRMKQQRIAERQQIQMRKKRIMEAVKRNSSQDPFQQLNEPQYSHGLEQNDQSSTQNQENIQQKLKQLEQLINGGDKKVSDKQDNHGLTYSVAYTSNLTQKIVKKQQKRPERKGLIQVKQMGFIGKYARSKTNNKKKVKSLFQANQ